MFHLNYRKTARNITTVFLLIFTQIIPVIADDFNFLTRVTGDSIGDQFNRIALGNGDVNGDGYQDVLIGAPSGLINGYAKLFLGGVDFDTIPDLVFYGERGSFNVAVFGSSCAIIGDINGDLYDDILIGAPQYDRWWPAAGRAYLYYGGVNLDTIPDFIFDGEYWYHNLGGNVSGAGDVNGDGFDDWLINSPEDDMFALGRIYLYYGGEEPDSDCDVYFEGQTGDLLRFDNPALGDINNDGFDDLIFYGFGINGFVEIHLGSAEMDTIPNLKWGRTTTCYYTIPAAGVGDVNNDGYNDWWIHREDGHCLFFGSSNPDTIPDMLFEPEPPCTGFRNELASGDINGDGIDDIVIGAYTAGSTYGLVLGYIGGPDLDNSYDYIFNPYVLYEWLGVTIGLADVDGDSVFEVLAGGKQYQVSYYIGPGRVWFLSAINPVLNISFDFPNVILSWKPVIGASMYEIYTDTIPYFNPIIFPVFTVSSPDTFYIHQNVLNFQTNLFYRLKCINPQ